MYCSAELAMDSELLLEKSSILAGWMHFSGQLVAFGSAESPFTISLAISKVRG